MKDENITIISIVEDDLTIGAVVKDHINSQIEYCCDNHYINSEQALKGIPTCNPDVVIMDIGLPDISGVECMKEILRDKPDIKFVMFTVFDDDEYLFEALRSGASGYILKDNSQEEILESIKTVLSGGAPMSPTIARKVVNSFHKANSSSDKLKKLTPHQTVILTYVSDGLLNKEIAELLKVKEGTIKNQIRTIYQKLQVNNRVEASAFFRK